MYLFIDYNIIMQGVYMILADSLFKICPLLYNNTNYRVAYRARVHRRAGMF